MPHGRRLPGVVNHVVPVLAPGAALLRPQAAAPNFRGLAPGAHHVDLRENTKKEQKKGNQISVAGGEFSIKTHGPHRHLAIKPWWLLPGISSGELLKTAEASGLWPGAKG